MSHQIDPASRPFLTREQSRAVDRIASDRYKIPSIVLMENASRGATDLIIEALASISSSTRRVLICCGAGNNGGDGFAIARHLKNRGVNVYILLAVPEDKIKGDAKINFDIARAMRIPTSSWSPDQIAQFNEADIIVDAMLGTGFQGNVRSPMDQLITAINKANAMRIAIDVPSGLDCDSGKASNATICADQTITFVTGKVGFQEDAAKELVGELSVVDIGAPPSIINEVLQS